MVRGMLPGILVTLLCALGTAHAFSTYVQPSYPTVDDQIAIVLAGVLNGGDQFVDTSVRVAGNDVVVTISLDKCTGICPLSLIPVKFSLPLGRLSEGTYNLITYEHSIFDTAAPPDTATTVDTSTFRVYGASAAIPRIVGVYSSIHGESLDSAVYRHTNGDTLSVVGVFMKNCCAQFIADITYFDDTALAVTISDTGFDMCDCPDVQFHVTVAMVNVQPNWIRLNLDSRYWPGPRPLGGLFAAPDAPAVCLNVANSSDLGFCVYVDSSWSRYEIASPLLGRPQVLRLQPNPNHTATTDKLLFLDDVVYESDTLEGFENYSSGDYNVVAFRDGSRLVGDLMTAGLRHYYRLTYSNSINGSCSNYLWRGVTVSGRTPDTARVRLYASLSDPGGSIPVADRNVTRRGHAGPAVALELSLSAARLRLSGLGAVPGRVAIRDLSGRTLWSSSVGPEGGASGVPHVVALDGLAALHPGLYVLELTAGGLTVREKVMLDR